MKSLQKRCLAIVMAVIMVVTMVPIMGSQRVNALTNDQTPPVVRGVTFEKNGVVIQPNSTTKFVNGDILKITVDATDDDSGIAWNFPYTDYPKHNEYGDPLDEDGHPVGMTLGEALTTPDSSGDQPLADNEEEYIFINSGTFKISGVRVGDRAGNITKFDLTSQGYTFVSEYVNPKTQQTPKTKIEGKLSIKNFVFKKNGNTLEQNDTFTTGDTLQIEAEFSADRDLSDAYVSISTSFKNKNYHIWPSGGYTPNTNEVLQKNKQGNYILTGEYRFKGYEEPGVAKLNSITIRASYDDEKVSYEASDQKNEFKDSDAITVEGTTPDTVPPKFDLNTVQIGKNHNHIFIADGVYLDEDVITFSVKLAKDSGRVADEIFCSAYIERQINNDFVDAHDIQLIYNPKTGCYEGEYVIGDYDQVGRYVLTKLTAMNDAGVYNARAYYDENGKLEDPYNLTSHQIYLDFGDDVATFITPEKEELAKQELSAINIDEKAQDDIKKQVATSLDSGQKNTISVDIKKSDISEEARAADQPAVEQKCKEESLTIDAKNFFDLSMFVTVNGKKEQQITELEDPIEIQVNIPESIQKSGRTYYILRKHGDDVEIVGYGNTSPVTIKTNRFSTYAIAYKDADSSGNSSSNSETKNQGTPVPTKAPTTPTTPEQPAEPTSPSKEKEQPIASKVLYRLYNPNSGEHFYTGSRGEHNVLVKAGWKSEGTAWKAPEKGLPVYRLYNPNAGDHHYTTSVGERKYLVKMGWTYEGVGWYAASKDDRNVMPVYRQYNPNAKTGAHNFTTSKGENNHLVEVGWKAEGIAWYAMK